MKKRIAFILIILLYLVMSKKALSSSDERYRYLWNNEGLYIPLYSSINACLSNQETIYYVLNGVPIDDFWGENIGNGITKIYLDESTYFFRTEYIKDSITDPYFERNSFWIKNINAFTIPIEKQKICENLPDGIESNINIVGRIKNKLIILNHQTFSYSSFEIYETDVICLNPLCGMITEEDAKCIAQSTFKEVFTEFDKENLICSISLVGCTLHSEDSYYFIRFFPEDEWQDTYTAVIDAIDGTIVQYYYSKETYG